MDRKLILDFHWKFHQYLSFVQMKTSMASQHYKISLLQIKSKICSALWIMLFWTMVAFYQYTDWYTTLESWNCLPADYEHWPFVSGLLISQTVGGVILGTVLVFLWENWLRNMSFSHKLGAIAFYYTSLNVILTYIAVVTFLVINPSIGGILPAT